MKIEKSQYIKIIEKDIKNGFKKTDLERLIGIPQNTISNVLAGFRKFSRQTEIKIERWNKSPKPDPLNLPKPPKASKGMESLISNLLQ